MDGWSKKKSVSQRVIMALALAADDEEEEEEDDVANEDDDCGRDGPPRLPPLPIPFPADKVNTVLVGDGRIL